MADGYDYCMIQNCCWISCASASSPAVPDVVLIARFVLIRLPPYHDTVQHNDLLVLLDSGGDFSLLQQLPMMRAGVSCDRDWTQARAARR